MESVQENSSNLSCSSYFYFYLLAQFLYVSSFLSIFVLMLHNLNKHPPWLSTLLPITAFPFLAKSLSKCPGAYSRKYNILCKCSWGYMYYFPFYLSRMLEGGLGINYLPPFIIGNPKYEHQGIHYNLQT